MTNIGQEQRDGLEGWPAAPWPPPSPSGVSSLKLLLSEAQYSVVSALVRSSYFETPFIPRFAGTLLGDATREMPQVVQHAAQVWMAGEDVPYADLANSMGSDVLEDLVGGRVLVCLGKMVRSPYIIVSAFGLSLLASPPLWVRQYQPGEQLVYIGPESYRLARVVLAQGRCERMLDLCTGTGLLAMLGRSETSVAVDLDDLSAEVASVNVELNDLHDRVEVRHGDLFGAVAGDTFDLITANPPFLPASERVPLPLCSNGGTYGDDVIRRIVEGAGEHLAPGGVALIYGESFGDWERPFVSDWLAPLLKRVHLSGLLIAERPQSAQSVLLRLAGLYQAVGLSTEDAFAACEELREALSAEAYYSYILQVTHGPEGLHQESFAQCRL